MPKSIFTPQRETDIHTTAPLHHAKGPTPRGRVGGRDKHALTVRTQARPHPSQPNEPDHVRVRGHPDTRAARTRPASAGRHEARVRDPSCRAIAMNHLRRVRGLVRG